MQFASSGLNGLTVVQSRKVSFVSFPLFLHLSDLARFLFSQAFQYDCMVVELIFDYENIPAVQPKKIQFR